MPAISLFYGIVIYMYHDEHNPPHFHVFYKNEDFCFDFEGNLIEGTLGSRKVKKMIKEWCLENRLDLEENWKRSQSGLPLNRIKPLI